MTQQIINTGNVANDGTGDTLRTAGIKINQNFSELYSDLFILPNQANNAGKVLSTNGLVVSWQPIAATNGVLTTGNYTDPSWITSLSYSKLLNAPALSIVATSGSYLDLINKPTIPAAYILPASSSNTLGGVIIATNGGITNNTGGINGSISLTQASTTQIGGVLVDGTTITMNSSTGKISAVQYTLPTATVGTSLTGTLGGVKVDGSTITIGAGVISAVAPTNITGNSGTTTKLIVPVTINGVNFDGSSNITVPASASTLTGTALNSTVVSSNLTSVGTLSSLNVTGNTVIGGNLTVTGTTTTTNTSTLTVTNKTIIVSSGSASSATSDGSGLVVNGPTIPASILYTAASSSFTSNIPFIASTFTGNLVGNVTGNVSGTANTITGIYSGAITSSQITTGLGYTPLQATSLSVTTNSASGNGSLAYSGGIFTFTPPNLSSYLTSITSNQVTTALGYTPLQATSLSVTTNTASGNGSLSYSGGVFSFTPPNLSGYLTSINSSQITTALGFTPYNATNPANYITSSSLSVVTANASGNGNLTYTSGTFTFTPPNLSNYLTGITGTQVTTALGYTPVQLTQFSVQTNSANGSGSLSYSNTTGVFTFVPPVIPVIPTYTVTTASASGSGSLNLNGTTFTFTPPVIPTYTVTTASASGSGSLSLSGSTFTFTPPVIPTIPTYTITTNSASGNGSLTLNGTVFTYTPPSITPTFSAQNANVVLAGPSTGANAVPTFRQLVSADLPTATTSTAGAVIIPAVSTSGINNTSGTIGIATASTTQLGGVKIDGSTITINGSGQLVASASGGALSSRTTVSVTTSSLASGGYTTSTVTAAKGYALYSIQVSAGAWVTVYTSSTAQTNDTSRSITTDPTPGSGVIAEAITTTATTTYFTPAVFGFNTDGTISSNMYLKIYNNSGSTTAITVTVTYLKLEN